MAMGAITSFCPGNLYAPRKITERATVSDGTWDVERLRFATDAAGVALWSWNVDTDKITLDDRAFDLWGVPRGLTITFEELSSRIHPADLDKVRAAFAATRERFGAYETDFRILLGKEVRWISARGRGYDQGIVGRIMYGVFIDVSVRRRAEEAREMITGIRKQSAVSNPGHVSLVHLVYCVSLV